MEASPTTSSVTKLLIPPAVIIVIIIGVFIVGVVIILCVRKLLTNRGLTPHWLPKCCTNIKCSGCTEHCLMIAETFDCNTPNSKSCLDTICPSKEQCSLFWSKVCSCYCCTALYKRCKEVECCPQCATCECPQCDCFSCHCECTPPECKEINCGCFKVSFG